MLASASETASAKHGRGRLLCSVLAASRGVAQPGKACRLCRRGKKQRNGRGEPRAVWRTHAATGDVAFTVARASAAAASSNRDEISQRREGGGTGTLASAFRPPWEIGQVILIMNNLGSLPILIMNTAHRHKKKHIVPRCSAPAGPAAKVAALIPAKSRSRHFKKKKMHPLLSPLVGALAPSPPNATLL